MFEVGLGMAFLERLPQQMHIRKVVVRAAIRAES
jgi:hypothetical protein